MELTLGRILVGAAVAGLVIGAGYLYTVRGEAILMDLAAMGSALLCM
jgi:hypothetical protein